MKYLKKKLRKYLIYNSIKNNKIHKDKLNQGIESLYSENYKTLDERNEDTNKMERYPELVNELEELISLECPCSSKPSIESMQSLSKFQWCFFFLTEIELKQS